MGRASLCLADKGKMPLVQRAHGRHQRQRATPAQGGKAISQGTNLIEGLHGTGPLGKTAPNRWGPGVSSLAGRPSSILATTNIGNSMRALS